MHAGIDRHRQAPLRRTDERAIALDAERRRRGERHLDGQPRQPRLDRPGALARDRLALFLLALGGLGGHVELEGVGARQLAEPLVAGGEVKARAEPGLEPLALLDRRDRLYLRHSVAVQVRTLRPRCQAILGL